MRRSGIRRSFVSGFFGILAVTALASVLAVGIIFYQLGREGEEIPKIEEQVGDLEQYARRNSEELLSGDGAAVEDWEARVADANGVSYALLDAKGRPIAGDPTAFSSPPSLEDVTGWVNTLRVSGDFREEAVALILGDRVGGYLLLRFPLENSALSWTQELWLIAPLGLAALLPVAFLVGSTLVFARRLGHRFSGPIGELMGAVDKIRRRDLDFSIRYDGSDELGDLCRAFNNLRAELRESLEREWRQGEEVREMLAALSHDLRTPATIIRGHVEGLSRVRDGKRAERMDRYLPVLETSSDRLVKLLNDMMLVLTFEQGGFGVRPQPVDLAEELSRKAEVYELRARERGVVFSYEAQDISKGARVFLDPHRLEQVLDNLFENALRFTPKGGGISLRVALEGEELQMVLRDSGPGVDPEDLPHVFEKFYRGKNPNPGSPQKSTGLGLYICKRLVEEHGGRITLGNHPDGGCEVNLRFPLGEDLPWTTQAPCRGEPGDGH